MSNPNDDPDVISGLCDDAQKEMATNPGPSQSRGCPTGWPANNTERYEQAPYLGGSRV